jgi:hypothetical protein
MQAEYQTRKYIFFAFFVAILVFCSDSRSSTDHSYRWTCFIRLADVAASLVSRD